MLRHRGTARSNHFWTPCSAMLVVTFAALLALPHRHNSRALDASKHALPTQAAAGAQDQVSILEPEKARPVLESFGWELDDPQSANFNCEWLQGGTQNEAYLRLREELRQEPATTQEQVASVARRHYPAVGFHGLVLALGKQGSKVTAAKG